MDISEGQDETDFWIEMWNRKNKDRDAFYEFFKELLPPNRNKKLQKGKSPEVETRSKEEFKFMLEKFDFDQKKYDHCLKLSAEKKEEQYQWMGKPQYKRKQLHFKSIELFTKCVKKYF